MSELTAIQKVELQLEGFKTLARDIVAKTNAIKIVDTASLAIAQELQKECTAYAKSVEDKRTAITKPMNDFLKEVNSRAKTLVAPVEESKTAIKTKILAYNKEQARLAEEEAKKLREAQEAEEAKLRAEEEARLAELAKEDEAKAKQEAEKLEAERQAREAQNKQMASLSTAPKVKGLTKRWTYKILDEDKVPRNFCSSDSKKINEAIKGGARLIAGLEIFEIEDVR